MKAWQKIALITLGALLLLGLRVYFVWKDRQDPGVTRPSGNAARKLSGDELAVVRQMYITTFDAAKDLEGKPVWMQAGYSLPYYIYSGGHVQFARRKGLLPAAAKLSILSIVQEVAPAKEVNRVPHGSHQYFAVFALAGIPGKYAAPIGYAEGGQDAFFCDQLFYYDDPHTIYDNWPKDVWAAIDAHQVKPGMSELQSRMAVGILMTPDGTSEGNRTVTYDMDGKKIAVTYVDNKATTIAN